MNNPIKHCVNCGKQLHREALVSVCRNCFNEACQGRESGCDFCKETHCPAYGESFFKELNETLFVDFRFDAEFNQIDCQFGTLDENNQHKHAEWSNWAIDISYCPICGRKLPPVE